MTNDQNETIIDSTTTNDEEIVLETDEETSTDVEYEP